MDPRRDLLKMGWMTLVGSVAVVAVLALLPSRAGAADTPRLYDSSPAHGFRNI